MHLPGARQQLPSQRIARAQHHPFQQTRAGARSAIAGDCRLGAEQQTGARAAGQQLVAQRRQLRGFAAAWWRAGRHQQLQQQQIHGRLLRHSHVAVQALRQRQRLAALPQPQGRQRRGVALTGCGTGALPLLLPSAPTLSAVFAQHAGARRHQMVQRDAGQADGCGVGAVRSARRVAQRQAGAHVSDALAGERVAAQVGKRAVVVEPTGLLQLVKHGHKTIAVETRAGHHAKAHPVRLALHVARKIQLALRRQRLAARDGGARHVGVAARRQRAQDHRGQHPGRQPLLARHHARNVPLRHMAQLVRDHRRQLLRPLGDRQQPQVHPHVATRQRKRVDRFGAVDHQLPGQAIAQLGRHIAARARRCDQRLPDRLQIVHQHRIVEVVWVAVDLRGDLVAQAPLVGHRHARAIAQTRQAGRGH